MISLGGPTLRFSGAECPVLRRGSGNERLQLGKSGAGMHEVAFYTKIHLNKEWKASPVMI